MSVPVTFKGETVGHAQRYAGDLWSIFINPEFADNMRFNDTPGLSIYVREKEVYLFDD